MKTFLFWLLTTFLVLSSNQVLANHSADSVRIRKSQLDSLYIDEVEDRLEPSKVLHAEPLFIDLIRDLGARKGEAEWNFGLGLTDLFFFDRYNFLIEYEFAPIDRLGLEFEIPVTIFTTNPLTQSKPSNRIESIKLAVQWSFFVSEEAQLSAAFGYINETFFPDLNSFANAPFFIGNKFNPFFVVAKRWGNNFHTLSYSGVKYEMMFNNSQNTKTAIEQNTSIHYMIRGTRNFIGVEFNKQFVSNKFDLVIRPQMRLQISDETLLGIAAGMPVNREEERFSIFIRLIYEPVH